MQDWRNNVGTGPFDLVEWVDESLMVWNKVDDYWGFDEKFPDNRLPYIDEVRAIFMKEPAARIAAIRTRQVDHLGSPGNTQINSVDDFNSLRESNPSCNSSGACSAARPALDSTSATSRSTTSTYAAPCRWRSTLKR